MGLIGYIMQCGLSTCLLCCCPVDENAGDFKQQGPKGTFTLLLIILLFVITTDCPRCIIIALTVSSEQLLTDETRRRTLEKARESYVIGQNDRYVLISLKLTIDAGLAP